MCLIVFAYKIHPDYPLVLSANRDEFYDRPTAAARWWEDKPDLLGGRDLEAKGTWMGVSKNGRFAAVTNYRDIQNIKQGARSRGDLPVDFLEGSMSAQNYGHEVSERAAQYNGFNLLAYDGDLVHFSNYENKVNVLQPGIYGLSNALLDTPWPKVTRAKEALQTIIAKDFEMSSLVSLLSEEQTALDAQLPSTGLNHAMEKALSAMCIRTPNYGTCCSTALTIDQAGEVNFIEKSYPVGNRKDVSVSFKFDITS